MTMRRFAPIALCLAAGWASKRAAVLAGLIFLILLAIAAVGCATEQEAVKPASPTSTTPAPSVASAPVRALRLRFTPALDASDVLARELGLSLETALAKAGLQLIRDPAAHVDARLELASAARSVGVAVHGAAFLSIEGAGVLIDQVQTAGGFHRRDQFASEAAQELLDAVLKSPRLAAFASSVSRAPCPPAPAGVAADIVRRRRARPA